MINLTWQTLGAGNTSTPVSISITGLQEIGILINASSGTILQPYYSIIVPVNFISTTARNFMLEGGVGSNDLVYVTVSSTSVAIHVRLGQNNISASFAVVGR